jgi:hypothetical protein
MFMPSHTDTRTAARRMPTAAKLVGAVTFFGVGWLAALQVLATVPEGTPATWFPLTIALIGLWQGWSVAGALAGDGRAAAVANGVRTSIQIAFVGLVVFALRAMFLRSVRLRYDGLGEALGDASDLFIAYAMQSFTLPVWGVLLLGGVIGGLICEGAARRWR